MNAKIAVLGAGHVGSHVARALAALQAANEIVLIDLLPEKAQAQVLDIMDALSFLDTDVTVRAGTHADCRDADITIVAIGKAREPGQTRLDLLKDSVLMSAALARQLGDKGVGGLMISITNPCDIIADVLRQLLGLERFRAFGTGTLLDTARLKGILSRQTGAPRRDIRAYVLGEHGDSSMIPCSCITIGGLCALNAPGFDAEEALTRTRMSGMDIINGKGSTEFGIGQVTALLCRAILSGEETELPLSVHLEGEYGLSGINCGVPCAIGRRGIERIVQLPLTQQERDALYASAAVLQKHTRLAEELLLAQG